MLPFLTFTMKSFLTCLTLTIIIIIIIINDSFFFWSSFMASVSLITFWGLLTHMSIT